MQRRFFSQRDFGKGKKYGNNGTDQSRAREYSLLLSRKDTFAKAFDSVGQNGILGTVTRYNQIICMAPPRVYEVYVCLYIECCTYEAAAERLGYSVSYIYKSNKKIVDFFYEAMNQEVA